MVAKLQKPCTISVFESSVYHFKTNYVVVVADKVTIIDA
jgi:hypothetical protein